MSGIFYSQKERPHPFWEEPFSGAQSCCQVPDGMCRSNTGTAGVRKMRSSGAPLWLADKVDKGNIATSAPLVKRCLRAGTPLGRCQGRCGIFATDLHLSLTYAIYNSTLPQMRPASCYVSCPQRQGNLTASSRSLLTRARVAKYLISLGKLVNKAKGENGERNFRYLYILYTFLFLF